MRQKVQNRKSEGFTIIEVLIVLAIAGLIMMVVFMAVPALQRNARNTQRRNDVSALLGAYQEQVANSAGQLPASCSGTTTTCWVRNVKMSNYIATSSNVSWTYSTSVPSTVPAPPTSLEGVNIRNGLKCATNGQTAVTTNATIRSIVALYRVESAGGTTTQCLES